MSNIHHSAVVDPKAVIHPTSTVGPFCVIEGDVNIGPNCTLRSNVFMRGPLTIGEQNTFYPNTYIGYEPQDYKFDPNTPGAGTIIGNENIFREGVSVHRATGDTPTTIGNHNMMMVNSHLGHDVVMGNNCVMVNGSLIGGHVQIGDGFIAGGNAVAHQHIRLGRLSMISGVIGITQDLLPFCVCYHMRSIGSLNIVGLRRNGYRKHIKNLQHAFDIILRMSLPNQEAAALIRKDLPGDELCEEMAVFVETSKRGICSLDRIASRKVLE
ncbi:acyl-ACP--UDP-N-acetylglucosamine O-acyltransferase [Poriferisphaera sp. WC338]|uniref:acyl-ACP--UDP-N-acetylglucosamine O-acyltransferase n=1 Tax=Poriferisphaera sp. WC338 TaxID=3425129 RepID=UPI003D81768C